MKLILFIILIFMSCYKPADICGICRVYIYEYNDLGDFRKATITESKFCNEDFKSDFKIDTLELGWYRQTQRECF